MKKRLLALILTLVMVVSLLPGSVLAAPSDFTPYSAGDVGSAVADASTLTAWKDVEQGGTLADSSRDTGRIWTDKSVFTDDVTLDTETGIPSVTVEKADNADFMVALSAISSASSLTASTSTTTPLDIVLVLDLSGSMDENMYSYEYQEEYEPNTLYSYYILLNGVYQKVDHNSQGWYYGSRSNRVYVTPKTAPDDSNPDHVQFFSRQTLSTTNKMTALKAAVNSFLASTAVANRGISNENEKHRVSIVKFAGTSSDNVGNDTYESIWGDYNFSQIVTGLTVCENSGLTTLQNSVNDLKPGGATSADYGLNHAERALDGIGSTARKDAEQVIIFFTDGEPNHGDNFDGSVANAAIQKAKGLKTDGVTIYSIGIFSGANPADTSTQSNAFMHGVSSNYPNAQSYTNLGTRAPDSDYYKATADADELNDIFKAIFEEIQSGTGSPTYVEDSGHPNEGGYITFTDTLGDYMEVKDFNAVVFAGKKFTAKDSSISGNVTTYTFSGQTPDAANSIYPEGNLEDLIITVTKASDGKTGDTVTVQIPASLIPLRYYEIATVNGEPTMTISETYPMRIFYSVGRTAAAQQVANGTLDEAYASANTDSNDNVLFYSNAFTMNAQNGSTTAVFTPAPTNSFYYFTQDTALYTAQNDEAATGPVDTSKTYYYQQTWYQLEGSTAQEVTGWFPVSGSTISGSTKIIDGQLYIVAGTRRLDRASRFATAKADNATDTADNAIAPTWTQGSDAQSHGTVTVYLGNNGVIPVEKAGGTLSVTKVVNAAAGHTVPTADANKEFSFTVTLTPKSGNQLASSYSATKTGESTPVTLNVSDNKLTFSLKASETITIYGLNVGDEYVVTESDYTTVGYTTTATDNTAGTISAEAAAVTFTNTYAAQPATLTGSTALKVTKTLTGRDWAETDKFTFTISAVSPTGAPLPEYTSIEIGKPASGDTNSNSFGDITFTKPGTYKYTIAEQESETVGMTTDTTNYTVTVTVTDVNGQLTATPSYSAVKDGETVAFTYATDGMTFANTYDVEAATVVLGGTKTLNGKTLEDNMFQFEIVSVQKDSETAITTAGQAEAAGIPMPYKSSALVDVGNQIFNGTDAGGPSRIYFGSITFDGNDVGHTYTYKIKEVAGSQTGMTYDATEKTVTVVVTSSDVGRAHVVAMVNGTTTMPSDTGYFTFTNTYKASDATLDGSANLQVEKVLTGRDWTDADAFTFTISAADGTPMPIDGNTVTIKSDTQNHKTAFSDITYTQAGTYIYEIRETAPTGDSNGMTYSTDVYTVTVTVTDNNGQLVATSEMKKGTETIETHVASFTNRYAATGTLTGSSAWKVSKTIDGRTINSGETFTFALTGSVGAPMPAATTLTLGAGQLSGTMSFGNVQYDQDDIGTHTYTIKETAGTADGMTYSQAEYQVTVTVEVDSDDASQLKVTSEMKQVKNDDGTVVTGSEVVSDNTAAFTNTYSADPATVTIGTTSGATLTKKLEGKTWEDETFYFEIEQATTDPEQITISIPITSVTAPASGNSNTFTFGPYTFDKVGTYRFTVKETNASGGDLTDGNGMTYAKASAAVTVTVTDNKNGQLEATVSITGGTFTNTYKASDATLTGSTYLQVEKTLTGRDWTDEDTFTFIISAANDTPMPEDEEITITNASTDHKAAFGDITYSEPGEYVYEITETAPTGDSNGMTYSNEVYTVTVTVTDNGQGQLAASSVMKKGDVAADIASFTNTYTVGGTFVLDGEEYLEITKELVGRAWQTGDSFEFTISSTTPDAPMPSSTTITIDAADTDHTAAFGDITFDTDDLDKTFVYEIKETQGSLTNMTYDTHTYTVTVTPRDNGLGGIGANISGQGGTTFTNTYTNPGTITITPVNITVYMGGDGGYDAVVDDNHQDGTTSNSLPHPLFRVSVPEGSGLDANNMEGVTFTSGTKSWTLVSDGNGYYHFQEGQGQDPVRVTYTDKEGNQYISDAFEIADVDDVFTTFTIAIYRGAVEEGSVSVTINGKTYGVATGTGTLTVRGVQDNDPTSDVEHTAPAAPVESETAVAVVPEGTTYTLNNLGVALPDTAKPSLLFDNIITSDGVDRITPIQERSDEVLGTPDGERSYEIKYLDLVDANNGNAWIKASNTIDIYWGYPEGTDKDTEFVLLHFKDLHRDGAQSGFEVSDIATCDVETVRIENTENGIRFQVGSGGFSPFVLIWDEEDGSSWPPIIIPDVPEDNTPNWLNTDDHYAYIVGYDDGTVKPNNNITRAEVATIFFRLLTDEAREYFWSTDSGFSDVKSGDWYNNAVSTMVNAGIITGYADGTFRPNDNITRAEFATIAARFLSNPYSLNDRFYDTEGHWAEVYINRAAEADWIDGYPDGTFRPDQAITRAEAMKLVNAVLGRAPHEDHLLPDMIVWPDNPKSAWYYEDVQEATNSHDYVWSSSKSYEIWTELLENRNWSKLEKEWSNAYSAPGGQVMD